MRPERPFGDNVVLLSSDTRRGYLIDLDGTLVSGETVLQDARWLIERTAGRFMLVSNNAEHTPLQLARRLNRLGLDIPAGRIVLAGTAAIDLIARERPGARLLLLASTALRTYARQKGLNLCATHPEIVLVGRDRQFTYKKLAVAVEAIHRGAELIVANPDSSHPGPNGEAVPETGALAAALIVASGIQSHRVIGKPERGLFDIACRRLGIELENAIMIGDNAATDGAGALRLGMRFVHVRNGDIRSGFGEPALTVPKSC